MAQAQYAKYVIPGPWRPKGVKHDSLVGHVSFPPLIMENKRIFPEALHHVEIFQIYGPGPGIGCGFEMEGGFSGQDIKDVPQAHSDGTETFIYIGTDHEHPEDLGGEVELWLGKGKDAEKFVFDTPTTVVIPPGLFHTPIYFRKSMASISDDCHTGWRRLDGWRFQRRISTGFRISSRSDLQS